MIFHRPVAAPSGLILWRCINRFTGTHMLAILQEDISGLIARLSGQKCCVKLPVHIAADI